MLNWRDTASLTDYIIGPQKPRLVARSAGADGSPWKKSNKALSLPIAEVPKDIRPVLGCVLWRVHESGATRWDVDRTMLLCDDEKVVALAKKLGLATKSTIELRKIHDTKIAAEERRETSGELEREFNIPEVSRMTPTDDPAKELPAISISSNIEQPAVNNVEASSVPNEAKSSEPSSSLAEDPVPLNESSPDNESADVEKSESKSVLGHSENAEQPKPHENDLRTGPTTDQIDHTEASAGAAQDGPFRGDMEVKEPVVQPSQSFLNTLAIEKEHSIAEWVKSLMDAGTNSEPSGRNTPISGHSAAIEATASQTEPAKAFKPLTYRQAVTGKVDEVAKKSVPTPKKEVTPSPRISPIRSTSPPKLEDPLDSDEEIVVFNPKAKRLSAQRALQNQQSQQVQPASQQLQQTQRPQTPKSSPRQTHMRNTSGGRSHVRGGYQRQPRSGPPPVVIDPDSFGRGLATNPQASVPRTFSPYGAHGRVMNDHRGNHRAPNPRPPAQSTPSKVLNGASVTSIADPAMQAVTDRSPATNGLITAESAPMVQAPVIATPSPESKLNPTINGSPAGHTLSGPTPAVNGMQSAPGVPLRAERPRYSPRGSPRRAPAEPEVGYILKSGRPREATRGRGKLWVP